MATKHYKLAALETTYVSLSILEPVGFTHSHTVQHNLNWTSVIVGPSQSHLALIDGRYLVHLGKRSASSGLWVCLTFLNVGLHIFFQQMPYWLNSSDQLNSTRKKKKVLESIFNTITFSREGGIFDNDQSGKDEGRINQFKL